MRRGVAASVAVAGLVACAPAWASTAAADTGSAVRHSGRVPAAHSQLKPALGPLALSTSPGAIREAGLTAAVGLGRPTARLSITPGTLGYRGGRVKFAISAANATRCILSSKPRFFAGPNPRRVRCHGKQTVTLPAVAVGLHWSFKFTARNAAGQVAVARRKLVLRKPPFVLSRNWAGYVVPSTSPVTAVSGQFTVPKLNCKHTPNAGESIWVGIGGATGSEALLQTGVRSDCIGGVQDNNPGWWEQYPPLPETDFDARSLSVAAGDVMQASVTRNVDGSWTTRLDDTTQGISGVMTTGVGYGTMRDSNWGVWQAPPAAAPLSYAGGSTAEWIVEDFAFGNGSFVPLADFGKVAFSGLTTSLPSSWALTKAGQVGLAAGPFLLAAPSGPDSSGRGFSVTYTG